jgi:hypothetical protein
MLRQQLSTWTVDCQPFRVGIEWSKNEFLHSLIVSASAGRRIQFSVNSLDLAGNFQESQGMSIWGNHSLECVLCKRSGALLLFVLTGVGLWLHAALVPNQTLITSIKLEGSNVVIQAQVPVSSKLVALESKGMLTDSVWQGRLQETNIVDGQVTFRLPKLAENEFFRIRADLPDGTQPASAETRYVAAPAVTADGVNPNEYVLHFKGNIDGSDRITINGAGAVWEHVNWSWPVSPISINGISWNSRQQNVFASPGNTKLLPPQVQFRSAKVEVVQGRDIVACEKSDDGLVIYIDDTPSGAATYEFNVRLSTIAPAVIPKPNAESAHLKISATIDGSDRLVINSAGAEWEHKFYGWPTNVVLNGVNWSLAKSPKLANQGATQFLPVNVDFSTARVVSRHGRDLVAVESLPDAIIVYFGDNPNGSADYDVDIAFEPSLDTSAAHSR